MCYDSGSDTAMPGNCNGGSTPKPEFPRPVQETARPPIRLAEWEIQLLILVAINEGGAQSPQQVEYITWTILNRYANPSIATSEGFSSRLESILLSDPQQYHVVFGDPRESFPGGIFPGHLAGTGPIGETKIMETYASWSNWYRYLDEDNVSAVRNTLDTYSRGIPDPTNGADSFFHVSVRQGETRSASIRDLALSEGRLRDATATGWRKGNGLMPPWGLSREMVYWRQYPWP